MVEAVQNLRRALREKFPQAHASSWRQEKAISCDPEIRTVSGVEAYPKGAITEVLSGGRPCAFALLLAGLLEGGVDADFPQVALVEGNDGFDPDSYSRDTCDQVLWVRCSSALDMMRAGDLLARDGNLSVIVLDALSYLPSELRSLPSSGWMRVRQAAQWSGCRVLVLAPFPMVPGVSLRLALSARLSLADFDQPRSEVLARLSLREELLRYAT